LKNIVGVKIDTLGYHMFCTKFEKYFQCNH